MAEATGRKADARTGATYYYTEFPKGVGRTGKEVKRDPSEGAKARVNNERIRTEFAEIIEEAEESLLAEDEARDE